MNGGDRSTNRSARSTHEILAEADRIMRQPRPFGWMLLYGAGVSDADLSEELAWIRVQKAKLVATRQQAVEAIRDLRSAYTRARQETRAGVVPQLIGRWAASADWAHRVELLYRREEAAIRPYQDARAAVDEYVRQLDDAARVLQREISNLRVPPDPACARHRGRGENTRRDRIFTIASK